MRFERRGEVSPLTPRWRRFLLEALAGQDLDEIQSSEVRRADFQCLSGLLAIEMKTLEEDGSERMDNLLDELRKRPDWPVFFGSAPVQAMAKQLEDSEKVQLQLLSRIGRAIINHLKKANKQLGSHQENFPRKNTVRIMLIINEDHEIYEPQVVAYILQHALRRVEDRKYLYPNIDAVIFTSERHATRVANDIAFPIVSVEGPGLETAIWKRSILNGVLERWSRWNGTPMHYDGASIDEFETIDHIPDKMPRHELWRLQYRRNPYLVGISNDALRDRFDDAQVVLTLMGVKDVPLKPSREEVERALILFTHVTVEMNNRGIPVSRFAYDPNRFAAAAKRHNLPEKVVDWFKNDLGR